MEIKMIAYQSAAYFKMLDLRRKILREPLGLVFTSEQLAVEKNDYFFVVEENQEIRACFILDKTSPETFKMRQVAVDTDFQSKGIGKIMLDHAENFAKQNNASKIYCHARDAAKVFYIKNGWIQEGEEFSEVGIPHYKLFKLL